MTAEERVVDFALKTVAAGIEDFLELFDHSLAHSQLGELAAVAGEDPADYLLFALEDTDLVTITDDDKVIRLDLLLDGVVFTHRLSDREIAGNLVNSVPDLAAIDRSRRRADDVDPAFARGVGTWGETAPTRPRLRIPGV